MTEEEAQAMFDKETLEDEDILKKRRKNILENLNYDLDAQKDALMRARSNADKLLVPLLFWFLSYQSPHLQNGYHHGYHHLATNWWKTIAYFTYMHRYTITFQLQLDEEFIFFIQHITYRISVFHKSCLIILQIKTITMTYCPFTHIVHLLSDWKKKEDAKKNLRCYDCKKDNSDVRMMFMLSLLYWHFPKIKLTSE